MASKKALIHKSKVLRHPLIGDQGGLLRETGLIDNRSGMLKAWGCGLQHSVLWRPENKVEITNFVFDETMQGAIFGWKTRRGSSNWSEM